MTLKVTGPFMPPEDTNATAAEKVWKLDPEAGKVELIVNVPDTCAWIAVPAKPKQRVNRNLILNTCPRKTFRIADDWILNFYRISDQVYFILIRT